MQWPLALAAFAALALCFGGMVTWFVARPPATGVIVLVTVAYMALACVFMAALVCPGCQPPQASKRADSSDSESAASERT